MSSHLDNLASKVRCKSRSWPEVRDTSMKCSGTTSQISSIIRLVMGMSSLHRNSLYNFRDFRFEPRTATRIIWSTIPFSRAPAAKPEAHPRFSSMIGGTEIITRCSAIHSNVLLEKRHKHFTICSILQCICECFSNVLKMSVCMLMFLCCLWVVLLSLLPTLQWFCVPSSSVWVVVCVTSLPPWSGAAFLLLHLGGGCFPPFPCGGGSFLLLPACLPFSSFGWGCRSLPLLGGAARSLRVGGAAFPSLFSMVLCSLLLLWWCVPSSPSFGLVSRQRSPSSRCCFPPCFLPFLSLS